jgi:acyl carrier protein|tara:strand:- start:236 stop:496 length:261 start_codon:yes stop_codon:yes gene_type:complete
MNETKGNRMTDNELLIKTVIAKELNISIDSIGYTDLLVKDLGADSLDVVELVLALEGVAGVIITDTDISSLNTVQDVLDLANKVNK